MGTEVCDVKQTDRGSALWQAKKWATSNIRWSRQKCRITKCKHLWGSKRTDRGSALWQAKKWATSNPRWSKQKCRITKCETLVREHRRVKLRDLRSRGNGRRSTRRETDWQRFGTLTGEEVGDFNPRWSKQKCRITKCKTLVRGGTGV